MLRRELEIRFGVWEKDLDWKCEFKRNGTIDGV